MSKHEEHNEDFSKLDIGKILGEIDGLQLSDNDKDAIITEIYHLMDSLKLLVQGTEEQKKHIFARIIFIMSKRLVECTMDKEQLQFIRDMAKELAMNNQDYNRYQNIKPTTKTKTTISKELAKEINDLGVLNKTKDPITKSDIQDLVIDLNTTEDVMDFIKRM